MPQLVFRHRLRCGVEPAWQAMLTPAHLAQVSFPFLRLQADNLPARFEVGTPLTLRITLWCIIPWSIHRITFVSIDDATHTARTEEQGGAIQYWRHQIRISTDPRGCVVDDVVDFEAGALNGFVWLFSQALYRFRYLRWKLSLV